jgi:D-alanyl-D-alanine carboxypeptidase/D-alanyl-D-alanine-endopeptidase (penicillin-binding protein 4)
LSRILEKREICFCKAGLILKFRKKRLLAPLAALAVVGLIIAAFSSTPFDKFLSADAGQVAAIFKSTVRRTDNAAVETAKPEAAPVVAIVQPTPQVDAAEWLVAHGEQLETHGVLIESLDGKRLLAAHNADVAFNPASLVKLATTLVALRKLSANYSFTTRIYTDGDAGADGALRGRLYVQSDDPLFGDAHAQAIRRELEARGIKRISSLAIAPNLCFNFVDDPQEAFARLQQALKSNGKSGERASRAETPRRRNGRRKDENSANEPPPEFVAAQPTERLLFTLKSHRLRDVLLYMNAHSNNFLAEHIGALVGGADEVQRFLREDLHLPADKTIITHTSGLEFNRLTPRGVLTIIRALIDETRRQGMRLEDIAAVAGDTGTLRHRFADTPLAGAVVGKTGTLTQFDGGTANLAGVVHTKNSGEIVFALFDMGRGIWKNHQLEELLLNDVITQRDEPAPVALIAPRNLTPPADIQVAAAE